MTYADDAVLELVAHVDVAFVGVGEDDAARANQDAQLVVALVHEGWAASGHLVEQDA